MLCNATSLVPLRLEWSESVSALVMLFVQFSQSRRSFAIAYLLDYSIVHCLCNAFSFAISDKPLYNVAIVKRTVIKSDDRMGGEVMKKTAAGLLTALMVISLAACGQRPDTGNITETAPAGNDSVENTVSDGTSESEKGEAASETVAKDEQTSFWVESEPVNDEEGMKILVAYFSVTNTTEGIAELIADSISADLYEIVPEEPYTDADLNYGDDNSRTSIEMNDSSARPAISGSVDNMEQYDVVFVGYPIWWGEAPRILDTFMESYDFSGKTIVPFCTSGSSGIGSSATNLADLTEGAMWLAGTRFAGGSSRETVVDWVNSLGLNIEAE